MTIRRQCHLRAMRKENNKHTNRSQSTTINKKQMPWIGSSSGMVQISCSLHALCTRCWWSCASLMRDIKTALSPVRWAYSTYIVHINYTERNDGANERRNTQTHRIRRNKSLFQRSLISRYLDHIPSLFCQSTALAFHCLPFSVSQTLSFFFLSLESTRRWRAKHTKRTKRFCELFCMRCHGHCSAVVL